MYLFLNICGVPCVQIRLRDYGVLDFDAGDTRRQPPVDTTWQQVTTAASLFNFNYKLSRYVHVFTFQR